MLDLSVIILTYNEEMHIRRCLENVAPFAKAVYIIDSFSTDTTLEIAKGFFNVHILQNKWENNYAKQFNWGLANAGITTQWVLRLDADEYLLPELVQELQEKLPTLPDDVTGGIFNRRHIFMGMWMRRGIYPVKLLRVFRYGKGMCEQRLMDEHIQLTEGRAVEFEHDFCDHNLNNLSWFCHKHVNYAIREAVDLLDIELDLTGAAETDSQKEISPQALAKRMKKHHYARQPLFWRSFAYFCYRYFLKGACLDGKVGFIWTFLQGWWYRTLVDAKVFEIKQRCGNDKEKITQYIKDEYGISLK
ncbi:glycosyltransferase family 2 protein [uncultured Parabacteroides sp.]|uniref:glycosyltransferase family 2 protein n=1 Tax=uncultured Parabacteroides sp. TaxID=512312 RepID=UPI002609EB84|nr:glycosyltransferase family 2 protein [uncultured Parabacteroides sp.]